MTPSNSPACLRDFVGLPYGFRGEGGGVDCWQLVLRAARELYGLTFPDPEVPSMNEASAIMRDGFSYWRRVDDPQAGDAVCISLAGRPLHAGLVIEGGRFLHVLAGRDSCIERLDAIAWRRRIEGFYRWPNR